MKIIFPRTVNRMFLGNGSALRGKSIRVGSAILNKTLIVLKLDISWQKFSKIILTSTTPSSHPLKKSPWNPYPLVSLKEYTNWSPGWNTSWTWKIASKNRVGSLLGWESGHFPAAQPPKNDIYIKTCGYTNFFLFSLLTNWMHNMRIIHWTFRVKSPIPAWRKSDLRSHASSAKFRLRRKSWRKSLVLVFSQACDWPLYSTCIALGWNRLSDHLIPGVSAPVLIPRHLWLI